jgi:ABC-2 type transport system permease protein
MKEEGRGKKDLGGVTHGLVRYGRIYEALWRNSIIREMGFKINFLLWIVVELLWFILHLGFIQVMYLHTDHIASWSKWEVVLLMGTSHFIQQVFTAFFFNNCTQLSEHVRTGRLDFILLLPASSRFLLSLRHVDLGSFVNAASALVVVGYAAVQLKLEPTTMQVLGYLLLCGVGVLVHYSLMFIMASISFWTVRAQGIIWGYYNLFNIARMPDEVFRGGFKTVFTFVLPMLLVSNIPARVLVGKLSSGWMVILLLGLTCMCFAVSQWVWNVSMRRYTSASS